MTLKKLVLNKETLRGLETLESMAVQGAKLSSFWIYKCRGEQTYTCYPKNCMEA